MVVVECVQSSAKTLKCNYCAIEPARRIATIILEERRLSGSKRTVGTQHSELLAEHSELLAEHSDVQAFIGVASVTGFSVPIASVWPTFGKHAEHWDVFLTPRWSTIPQP